MKRLISTMASLAFATCLTGWPAFAQRGRGAGGGMGMGEGPAGSFGHANNSSMPRMGNEEHGSMTRSENSMQKPSLGMNSPTHLLSQNTKLSSRLQSLLPAGTNLQDAAAGFKNLGLFVASVHVSHNLGIPFDQLKSTMLANGGNLGKSIHTLNPKLGKKQVKSNVRKARREAKQDLKEARS